MLNSAPKLRVVVVETTNEPWLLFSIKTMVSLPNYLGKFTPEASIQICIQ